MLFEKKKVTPDDEKATLHTEQMIDRSGTQAAPVSAEEEDAFENPFEGKESVEIRYNLRAEEVKKGLLLLQKKQIYKRNIIYTAILAVIFVLYLITVIRNPGYGLGMIMLALSAAVIVVIWMMAWRYRSSQAKAVSQVKEDFNMTVYENGILVHQENGDFTAQFTDPHFQVRELDDIFLLDLNRQRVYILPKRCMDEQQITTLRRFFENNLVTDETKK